ncbi:ADP-ribosylation factor-binding protein Gga [Cochliomyia hominivorax]
MTTNEKILEEMLERVTNPSRDSPDNLAFQMFCMIVQSNNSLISKAHELIVKKMHSNNITVAIRAIGLLEECMSKGGVEFQKKTAKFTFLNELIALVLSKHPGPPAPVETKKRIMECLMLWTVEHQDKPKIQEAYDNLKKIVNFAHGPTTVNSNSPTLAKSTQEQRTNILGKDDKLVADLLKQGGEENYKKANLLIQHRFNQDDRRTDFVCQLKKIESTIEVLDEMLNSYSSDTPDADSRDIIQELYNTCKGHNEEMTIWLCFLGDEKSEFLEDVLNTKDLLMVVLQRYKELFKSGEQDTKTLEVETTKPVNTSSTIPISSATTANSDLLSEIFGDTLSTSSQDIINPITTTNSNKTSDNNTTMDELSEMFASINDNNEVNNKYPTDLLGKIDILKPTSVFESTNKSVTTTTGLVTMNCKDEKKTQGFKELKEIDKLSEEIFKQSLKEVPRLLTFKKEPEKITLNDLAKDKIQTSLKASKIVDNQNETHTKIKDEDKDISSLNDLTFNLKTVKEQVNQVESLKTSHISERPLEISKDLENENKTDSASVTVLKPLAEISIDLDEVTPLDEGQRLLLDDDIQVTLNFTADRPSQHVSVIVMAVTNKSKLPVKDFQFEASAKKPCKVRLLPPTDVNLTPSKPFRPSAPINQVLLLLNPTQKPVDLTCIVGYKLGDDSDPIKESIVAKDIPYV